MAKEVSAQIKLQIPAGKANPAPPVGPSLGQHGVNIMEFCKQFNAKTGTRKPFRLPLSKQRIIVCWLTLQIFAASPVV